MYMYGSVIARDFQACLVKDNQGCLYIDKHPAYKIIKKNLSSYEIISNESKVKTSSAIKRGLIGTALLGPVGLLAGMSAQKKNEITIALYWIDGKKSVIKLTSDQQYNMFLNQVYLSN